MIKRIGRQTNNSIRPKFSNALSNIHRSSKWGTEKAWRTRWHSAIFVLHIPLYTILASFLFSLSLSLWKFLAPQFVNFAWIAFFVLAIFGSGGSENPCYLAPVCPIRVFSDAYMHKHLCIIASWPHDSKWIVLRDGRPREFYSTFEPLQPETAICPIDPDEIFAKIGPLDQFFLGGTLFFCNFVVL